MSMKRFEVYVRPDEVDQLDWCEKRELSQEKITPNELKLFEKLLDRAVAYFHTAGCNDLSKEELSILSKKEAERLSNSLDPEAELHELPDWMIIYSLFSRIKTSL